MKILYYEGTYYKGRYAYKSKVKELIENSSENPAPLSMKKV